MAGALRLAVDPGLPIAAWADEIVTAIRDHQVVIVAGETGSGKTTQLPKLCLAAGRERVGHTQPRRIAARSLAERIAEEVGTPLGEVVGYQVRFTAKTTRQTRVKVMTDGILLAEIGHDRDLRRYDTLIIDEAHERSLNIDFLLGYLKQLLPRRPDLKVIVTSATIDTARFSAHFDDAPIIEVSGRTYPVELRWRPVIEGGTDRDLIDGICDAVTELVLDGPDGDILVFCSGEREIRDAADAIAGLDWPGMTRREVEILPLFARLSAHEQHRVFSAHRTLRVVLATNVAETSLTVPGIRSVVDPGFARISRWSARTKVQRLPIEPISQASANQRAGRCGRVAPGVCIRLYDEEDFLARPEFTEPEILRTNLAAVILQMAQARLGDIARFPFVEPPDSAQISDGVRLLTELGAIETDRATTGASKAGTSAGGVSAHPGGGRGRRGRGDGVRLTPIGHRLARLPVDPRLGRMLVEAERQGCLREAQAVVAGLTVQDVRDRPAEFQQQADALHRRFFSDALEAGAEGKQTDRDPSDIAALLRLWRYLQRSRKERSGNAFRRMCREEYLNFLRVREWEDLNAQLKTVCRDLGMNRNAEPAGLDRVHLAVLSGLLSHVGLLDERERDRGRPGERRRRGPREYLGARGSRFAISPGSAAARINPPLVMAVELVETTRLWARTVAPIEETWIEEVGAHLLSRSYSEPRWSARSGQVVATERVALLGVPIVAGRTVSYGRIDPIEAHRIFIQSALVEGQWHTRHHFWARNEAARAQAEQLAERTRRLDLLADDASLFAFYDARVPPDVVSVAHFDRWWRDARRRDEHLLDLSGDDLLTDTEVDTDSFPDHWTSGEVDLPVSYTFEPGAGSDGVTVAVELAQLNRVAASDFGWQVPGLRQELATELIRTLPKQWRARLVPAPDTAKRALAWLAEHPVAGEPLPAALGRAVRSLTGVQVPDEAWNGEAVPDHLRVRFVVTRDGEQVATGKDLPALAEQLGTQVRAELNAGAAEHTHAGATSWEFGSIAEQVDGAVVGYPALADHRDRVGVTVFATRDEAIRSHALGLRRLIVLTSPDPTNWVVSRISNPVKFALAASPYPSVPALLADCRLKATGSLAAASGSSWQVRDADAFAALRDRVRSRTAETMLDTVNAAADVLQRHQRVQLALPGAPPPVRADVAEQLAGLVHAGFIAATPDPYWGRLPRYLHAIELRLSAARSNPGRDRVGAEVIDQLEDEYAALCARYPAGPLPGDVADVGWLLEELRVSLFAQSLGTAAPVSAKRVRTAMAAVAPPR
ncbi:ATP-dependent RNA helicase HrpA [Micropruina sonneratiae]|uniref:ATP-dependent RNA helicase HrpA n=1 Tax=Micropruina sonneratiae TaxID=2986940 RepID=UPI00222708C8|nr:ATP-dependent RNA helicase HrpA [Micropruina sp. KQZ13P-5]MCW3157855.1 ATP-dependent RNA helicase HrpA [Micropruina sp. KQZ13P-5]